METAHEMGGLFLFLDFGEELTASLLETVAKVNSLITCHSWIGCWLLAIGC